MLVLVACTNDNGGDGTGCREVVVGVVVMLVTTVVVEFI